MDSRLSKFVEEVKQLIAETSEHSEWPYSDFEMDTESHTFTFKVDVGKGELCTVRICATEDYPDGTVLTSPEGVEVLSASVQDAFTKFASRHRLPCSAKSLASADPAELCRSPESNGLTTDSDSELDSDGCCSLPDEEMDRGLRRDLDVAQGMLGLRMHQNHYPGLESCEVYLLLTLGSIAKVTLEAWGLKDDEPLVVKLEMNAVHYRRSQRVPSVSVYLDSQPTSAIPAAKQLEKIAVKYLENHWKLKKQAAEGNPFLDLLQTLNGRLPTLSDFCMICDERHEFGGMLLPSVCRRNLCTFAFEQLGLMADVACLATQMEVVSLLMVLLRAASLSPRHQIILDPFPSVSQKTSNPMEPVVMALDPEVPDVDVVRKILSALPCPYYMSTFRNLNEDLKAYHELAMALVRWTVASNRCYLTRIRNEVQLDFMGTPHQFLMLADSPSKEKAFRDAKAQFGGSVFLFHGSPLENWHRILRKGLIVASGTRFMINAAAYGNGIYLSPQGAMSFNYAMSRHQAMGSFSPDCPNFGEEHSCSQDDKFLWGDNYICLAICEVVRSPSLIASSQNSPIWLLKDADHCCTRFLFVYKKDQLSMGSPFLSGVDLTKSELESRLRTAVQLHCRSDDAGGSQP